MVSRSLRLTACALAAVMAFSNVSITADASSAGSVLPSGGVGLSLTNNATALNNIAGTENKNVRVTKTVVAKTVSTGDVSEEENFKNLVIAQVNDYVNIRSKPGEDGEILGKLYDDSVGENKGVVNDWIKIKSGTVTGYVKAEFVVTGEEAKTLAKEVGTRLAKVTTTTLFVRQEPSTEASIISMVPIDEELVVMDEVDGWAQVDTQEGLGWVSKDYVKLRTEFVEAESKEEEEARLAKEAAERRRAREAAAAAAAAAAPAATQTQAPVVTYSGEASEMGAAVAEYALQFVGNPYVYGGSSLTNGTDCSGFVMSVYANFGVSLPHSSAADRSQGYAVEGGLENAQPGDLICYSGHVALYIGNGQIVHASTSKTGIIVSDAGYKRILAIRRIF
ncbi:MAG: NlpC/P60 family protein [Lachnospiraceae bacterium]|nr:NlpC/P60 family protein [Lachnospiraceae bacterium]